MLDTLKMYEKLKQALEPTAAETIAEVIGEAVAQLQESVSEKWFQRLDSEITAVLQAQHAFENLLIRSHEQFDQRLARIETALAELTEAQKRSEEEIRRLPEEMRDVRRQMGGIATSVGYGLEDKAYSALPALLRRDYGIEVEERLKRQFVLDREGQYIEVNIFGKAKCNGTPLTIVGESKAQLSKNDVDHFVRRNQTG